MQTTITPSNVSGPAPGKKMSKAKFGNTTYLFDATKVTMMQGQTYIIDYEDNDYNGNTYHNVSKAVPQTAPAGSAPRGGDAGAWTPERIQGYRRLEIAKACIQGNVLQEVADRWLAWVNAADKNESPY